VCVMGHVGIQFVSVDVVCDGKRVVEGSLALWDVVASCIRSGMRAVVLGQEVVREVVHSDDLEHSGFCGYRVG